MATTILVIEDSSDISRLLEHILRQEGYQTFVADDGPAGWEAFQRLQPDLVLLDVNLPGLSGLELCQQIKRVSGTPVIMLTVQAETEAVRRGLRAGADAYLAKPFEIGQLLAAVEHALRPRIRPLPARKGGEGGAEGPDH
ncbi:MAG: response regulator transcription factor [Chloroflexia bacterium]